jgi:hypothetical protein
LDLVFLDAAISSEEAASCHGHRAICGAGPDGAALASAWGGYDRLRVPGGVITLANDSVVEWLIALCESVRVHEPGRPLTVIPFDDEHLDRTREVAAQYGASLYDDPTLHEMDELGRRYWPGQEMAPHTMRKLCAFWGPYHPFLFLDADIVLLCSLEPYFAAFRDRPEDFMYFSTDVANVYRQGEVRDRMVHEYATGGFNSGAFMGRRGTLSPEGVWERADAAQPVRHGFVDNLEQSFINFCVDTTPVSKIHANEVVTDLVVAGSLMRLVRDGDGFVLADRRVSGSGRRVSMIHWAGYGLAASMPYARTFLRYRLPRASPPRKAAHQLRQAARGIGPPTPRRFVRGLRHWRRESYNWLAARGHVKWPP